MAERKPLTLVDNRPGELPASDNLPYTVLPQAWTHPALGAPLGSMLVYAAIARGASPPDTFAFWATETNEASTDALVTITGVGYLGVDLVNSDRARENLGLGDVATLDVEDLISTDSPNALSVGSDGRLVATGGGGGGQVDEVQPGDFIDVDSSDPAKPVVSVAISGSPSAGDYPGYDGSGGLEWTTPSGGGAAIPYITGLAQDCDLSDPLTFSPSLTLHNGGTSNRWAVLIGAAPDGITVDPADGSHTGNTTSAGIFDWTIAATPLDGPFTGHTAISHQRITVFQQGLLPTSVASCTGWLDATDPSTMFTDFSATIPVTTDGQTVQRMLDKASSDIWRANNTPVYNTNVLNGQSVLSFDQNDYMQQRLGGANGDLITAASHTIIIVARWQDVVNTSIGYGSAAKLVDAASYMGVHLATSPNRVALYNYASGEQYAEVNQAQNAWVIISAQHGGGNIRCRVNRGAWTTVASGNTGSLSSLAYVGAVGSSGWSSRIQQVAFFNTQLGDSDLEGVEDYFAWVSGISLP